MYPSPVRVLATFCAALLLAGSGLAEAAPANDNFAHRANLTGDLPITGTGSNVNASDETNEPIIGNDTRSVWYRWIAQSDGPIQIDTIGSNFDTELAVYTGTTVSNLDLVASNDDGGGDDTSLLTFDAVAGQEYEIQVTGYDGDTGAIAIHVQVGIPSPEITSPLTSYASTTAAYSYQITATNSPTSYEAYNLPYGLGVNYYTGVISGTPYYTGTFYVNLYAYGSTTASAVMILTVTNNLPVITSSTSVAGNQNQPLSYQITAALSPTSFSAGPLPNGLTLDPSTGLISGTPVESGYYLVTVFASNDNGAGPSVLVEFLIASDLPQITSDSVSTSKGRAFSYQILATNNAGSYSVDSLPPGLTLDPATGIISGKPTQSGFFTSIVQATNSFGTSDGEINFSITDKVSDRFGTRVQLHGRSVSLLISTVGATEQPGEPEHAGQPGDGSVWFTWVAPATAQYQFSADGGAIFAIYTGDTLASLHEVVSNRDEGQGIPGQMCFKATEGQSYQIAIDSIAGTGGVQSNISLREVGVDRAQVLLVNTTGGGSITPGFLGSTYRQLGQRYTIKATPAPGYLFGGWGNSIASSAPELTFVMQPDLALTAMFYPSPFLASAGTYAGLLSSSGEIVDDSSTGYINVHLGRNGGLTGTVTIEGGRWTFHGVMDQYGNFSTVIDRPHRWPLSLSLSLDLTDPAATISGEVSDDLMSANLTASPRLVATAGNPSAMAGAYTFGLSVDDFETIVTAGNGFGFLKVSAGGNIRWMGVLPDGTPASGSGLLAAQGSWPLYARPYHGHGSLSGWVNFAQVNGFGLNGELTWLRPADNRNTPNSLGFNTTMALNGGAYAAPPRGSAILEIAAGKGNLEMVADYPGDGIEGSWEDQESFTLRGDGQLIPLSSETGLTFYPAIGYFAGRSRDPVTGKSYRFAGAVQQLGASGVGLFRIDGYLGGVLLQPSLIGD